MDISVIRKLSESYPGGIKALAGRIHMSEQNLHRCIRENKIQAQDLEHIAKLLRVPISYFFDGENSRTNIETHGDYSPTSVNGNVSVISDVVVKDDENNNLQIINDKLILEVEMLKKLLEEKEKLLEEKERLIKFLTSK